MVTVVIVEELLCYYLSVLQRGPPGSNDLETQSHKQPHAPASEYFAGICILYKSICLHVQI